MAKRQRIMAGDPQLCVSDVLDDDDLLMEIIVRVGSAASLIRAASVCRRWLLLVSNRAFLRRFRKLHPPKLLGFYLAQGEYPSPAACFFPMLPQPPSPSSESEPELAALVRRTSFRLGAYKDARTDVVGCWNGRVVISSVLATTASLNDCETVFRVHTPLCSASGRGTMPPAVVIPSLQFSVQEGNFCSYGQLFSKEEEGDGDAQLSYFYVIVEATMDRTKSIVHESAADPTKSILHVYALRDGDGAWRKHLTLAADYFVYAQSTPRSVLVDSKIYVASLLDEILVLDLTTASSSFSTMQLPQGVDFRDKGATMLSWAHDSPGVYLMHANKKLELHVWLHKGAGNWLLQNSICLRGMCTDLLQHEPTDLIEINHVGAYTAEFVFLKTGRSALYLDLKHRTMHKVYEMPKEGRYFGRIYPFTMTWPPIFPSTINN